MNYTTEQLKALAYDEMAAIERAQANLRNINAAIQQKQRQEQETEEKQAKVKKKEVKDTAEIKVKE